MLGNIFFNVITTKIGKIQILSLKEKSNIIKVDFLETIDFLKSKHRDYETFMHLYYQNHALVKSNDKTFEKLIHTYFLDRNLQNKNEAITTLQALSCPQSHVIDNLSSIAIGTIMSYSSYGNFITMKEIKSLSSKLKYNHLPLIFPCHRVVPQKYIIDGHTCQDVGGYTAGSDIKRILLDLEEIEVK